MTGSSPSRKAVAIGIRRLYLPAIVQSAGSCQLQVIFLYKKNTVLRSLGVAKTIPERIILDNQTHDISLCGLEILVVATSELIR
jgi:hypothetical protein